MFAHRLTSIRQFALNKLTLLKDKFQLPEKWKGGRIEKLSIFWKNLLLDYKTVGVEVVQDAKSKPYKAAFVTTALGVLYTAMKTNPDEHSFYDSVINCTTALTLLGDPIRNPVAEEHIQYLINCRNQDLLRKTDLIFLTIMWVADYSKDCDIYAAHCKYLKPRYITFYERIVDVGMFGTWWNMKRKMVDYDVNPGEWEDKT